VPWAKIGNSEERGKPCRGCPGGRFGRPKRPPRSGAVDGQRPFPYQFGRAIADRRGGQCRRRLLRFLFPLCEDTVMAAGTSLVGLQAGSPSDTPWWRFVAS